MIHEQLKQIDTKELELPETVFIRDIETRVFQSITMHCLSRIQGVAPIEGNLIDNLLGREGLEAIRGIYVEQDQKHHSVKVKVEVNVSYGTCIPEKAEEIQTKIAQDISKHTGLRVGCVHIVFKNLISPKESEALESFVSKKEKAGVNKERYNDEF